MDLDHLTREYSQRLGVLTAAQLQAALDRFALGRLQDALPAPGGAFGQNVIFTTDQGEYVLRGKSHFTWQFAKERFFADLIHTRTSVPSPVPYLIDETTDIFGFNYAILPRLPGLRLDDKEWRDLSASDELGIARAMGHCLDELHAITWPHCADTDNDSGEMVPIASGYREWISATVEQRIKKCQEVSSDLTDADEAWCRQLLVDNASAIDIPFQPTLVHHDYKLGNVVLQPEGDSWHVSGVFDLMECYFGHPEEDLVRQVAFYELPGQHAHPGSSLPAAFVRAYTEVRTLQPGFRERFRINMLRDCLLIWEFTLREGSANPAVAPHVRKWFDPVRGFRIFAEPYVSLNPFP